MEKDYLQLALQTFNGGNWYGWKKDWTGEKRMSYENLIIIKEFLHAHYLHEILLIFQKLLKSLVLLV